MQANRPSTFATSLASQFENFYAWLYLMTLGTAGRLLWLFKTRHDLTEPVSASEWARFFHTGLRYDSVVMTYLMLPLFAWAALIVFRPTLRTRLRTIRRAWISILTFAIPILAFGNVAYYEIYGNVIDDFVFELFEAGNAQDVLAIAYSDYGLVPKLLFCVVVGVFSLACYRKFVDRPVEFGPVWQQLSSRRTAQVACSFVLLLFLTISLRGRAATRPLQRIDSGVTPHRVLNMGTLNPLYSLKSAFQMRSWAVDYFAKERVIGANDLSKHAALIAESIDASVEDSVRASSDPAEFSFSKWQRTAAGSPNGKPSHVFVLFLESYDSWPFLDKYRELELVESGRQLGEEGHLLLAHLPGANSSLKSSLVCLQGLFDTNRVDQHCLPTSMVYAFKQLGYTTRSINSFTSEWNDAERIAREQGFDEIYCTANIKPGGETANLQVHDRTLFEFTSERLAYDHPTLSFIRSSSYHGPWEVDLAAEDCEIPPISDKISLPNMRDEHLLQLAYGHLKYTDKMAGDFVRRMIKRFPDSLFVITGDHYGRHFITTDPPVYEGASVPLILYGPEVLKGTTVPENMAAGHADVVTTLIELCAPKGYKYTSLGKSVLAPCNAPYGIGEDYVIFPQGIVSLRDPPRYVALPWLADDSLSEVEKQAQIQRARKIYDAHHGVSYMLARRALEHTSERVAEKQTPANRY
ncbi:MAG: sulfatase-like hydrolase/transferase [Planctomycetaceae bacterium]|nr:sulfatase-like hydrolase/transferase [Planctomycetales bacterium]MCB9921286.1 sulfatase-like hydrolase/transferase [Planctomycetaceae bacterium]